MSKGAYIVDFGNHGVARIIDVPNHELRLEIFTGGDKPKNITIGGIDNLRQLQRGLYHNIRRIEDEVAEAKEVNTFGVKKG